MQDIAISYKEAVVASQYTRERDYWLNQLAGPPLKTIFPYDSFYNAPPTAKTNKETNMNTVEIQFPPRLCERFMQVINNSDTRLHMLLVAGIAILLEAYTGSKDITLGAPVLKQESQAKFINTVLILRNQLHPHITFKELLLQVKQTILDASKHVNYPLEALLYNLNIPFKDGDFPLFDIVVLLQNIHEKGDIRHIPYNMMFSFRRTGQHIDGTVEYNAHRYHKTTVAGIVHHYQYLMNQVLFNVELPLTALDIVPPEEKKRLLYEFNFTAPGSAYLKDKTLHGLVEEQTGKTPDHVALVGVHQTHENHEKKHKMSYMSHMSHMSYKEMNEKANQLSHHLRSLGLKADSIAGIMAEGSLEMVIGILAVLKTGAAYLPLAPEYPAQRIRYMLKDSNIKVLLTHKQRHDHGLNFNGQVVDIFAEELYKNKGSSVSPGKAPAYAYLVYTSGSTGKPKGVLVNHTGVVNTLSCRKNEYQMTEKTVSLQLFSCSFDGFVTSFFTPVISGAKVVFLTQEEIKNIEAIKTAIVKKGVTHFICVPVLYRLIIENLSREEASRLEVVTLAGDSLSPHLLELTRAKNEKLEISNEYGVTEASVMSTVFRHQELTTEIKIGRPIQDTCIYILNTRDQLQPIGVAGELCIAGVGLAAGYVNKVELTAERFLSFFYKSYMSYRTYITQKMYRTGDLARWLPDGCIEFLGRKQQQQQVKIRGFRVELKEIKAALLQHPEITDAVVIVKKSPSTEPNICAYIVSRRQDENPPGPLSPVLKEYLAALLPAYMIPTFFVELEKIPLSPNGKIDLKGLPEPVLLGSETYTPPRDSLEEKLVEIWSGVLDKRELQHRGIGIDDNFFDLGGHSLKATMLIARIHKELNLKIPLAELFQTPTIRGLADYIKENCREEPFAPIEPAEKKDYYELSSAQRRLFILQQVEPHSTAYNLPMVRLLQGKIEIATFEKTFLELIKRHESLRTSYHMVENQPVQRIHDEVKFRMEFYDASKEHTGDPPGTLFTKVFKNFKQWFDLSQAPLLRVKVVKLRQKENSHSRYLLMVDMHHIITDGISHSILYRDFMSLYQGEDLAPLRIHYKDFAQWQNNEKEKENIKKQEAYWLKQFEDEIPVLNLPFDYPRPAIQSFAGNTLYFELAAEETRALKTLALEKQVTLYMVVLAIFNILLAKLSSQEDIIVGTPIAGRRHADLEQVIGMFVNTLVMRNHPAAEKTFQEFLAEIKKKTLQAFENQEYQFEDLVDKVMLNRDASRNPLFDVMYTLQNFEETGDSDEPAPQRETQTPPGQHPDENKDLPGPAKFDITLNGMEDGDILGFNLEYCTKLFKGDTIRRFISYFKKVALLVAKAPGMKLGEMEIISGEEKKQLLYRFNHLHTRYPRDKTIHGLFAEQVEKTPDHTALVGIHEKHEKLEKNYNMSYLSYKALNQKSHQLALLLKEKGVRPDTIVGLMTDRSPEMIIGILAILKAGGAYMPIDPDYPEERINYMLQDSNAGILLESSTVKSEARSTKFETNLNDRSPNDQNEKTGLTVLNFEDLDFEFVSSFGFRISDLNPSNLAYIIYTSGTTGKPKGSLIQHSNVVQLMFHDNYLFDFSSEDTWTMFHSYCFDFSVWEMYGALLYGGKLVLVDKITARDPHRYLDLLEQQKVTVLNQTPAAFYNLAQHTLTGPPRKLYLEYVIFGGEALMPLKLKPWQARYPQTKLINMFGITETTVHVTFKELGDREIRLNISNIGQPLPPLNTYLLDRSLKLVPPGAAGELCVGGAGVGRGYLNRPELTGEKFIKNPYIPNERLYRSGDLGKLTAAGELEYLGRIDHQVKIRGYRIEPGEIQGQLLKFPGIKDAVVIEGHHESGDNYLCAYLVSDGVSFSDLREHLARSLPDYMIPSYFVEIEKIPLTPNGKIHRRALPPPEIKPGQVYVPPRDEIEEKMVEIWTGVLDKETASPIGINDNFFEIGGHSLKATVMTARVHKELNVQLPLAEVFMTPTIRELAAFIKKAVENRFISIEPAEEKEYYPLSSAQKRLYVLQQMNLESIVYNMPEMIPLAQEVEIEILEETFLKLIRRHESLRTSFHMIDEEPQQRIHDSVEFAMEYYNSGRQGNRERGRQGNREIESELSQRFPLSLSPSLPELTKDFIRPFDLSRAPLLRAGLIKSTHNSQEGNTIDRYLLLVDVHHIISDGVSHDIMVRDFLALYNGETPPPLPLQYRDFAQWQNAGEQRQAMAQQETYWLKEFAGEIPLLNMPLDYVRPKSFDFGGSVLDFHIDPDLTARLKELASRFNVTHMMLLLAIYNILLWKYSGQEDIVVGTVVAGRRHADLQNIIGFFVNMLPIRTTLHNDKRFSDYLMEVKEKAVNAYENQDYQFEELVSKLELPREPGRHPLVDVVFVLEEKTTRIRKEPGEIDTTDQHEEIFKVSHFDLMFHATVEKETIAIVMEYSTALFKPKTIERIADFYVEILEQVLGNEHIKLAEITSGHQFVTVESNLLENKPLDFDF